MNKLIIKIIIVGAILIAAASLGYAQTPIAPTTTVSQLSTMKTGTYSFYNGQDTIYFQKDTSAAIIKVVTIPVTAAACKPFFPVVVQRIAVGITINKVGQVIVTYSDGSTSVLTLKNSIIIQ